MPGRFKKVATLLPDELGVRITIPLRETAVSIVDPDPDRFLPKLAGDDQIDIVIAVDILRRDVQAWSGCPRFHEKIGTRLAAEMDADAVAVGAVHYTLRLQNRDVCLAVPVEVAQGYRAG
jgi:hypothetical protein